jgi:hypothetical protein
VSAECRAASPNGPLKTLAGAGASLASNRNANSMGARMNDRQRAHPEIIRCYHEAGHAVMAWHHGIAGRSDRRDR